MFRGFWQVLCREDGKSGERIWREARYRRQVLLLCMGKREEVRVKESGWRLQISDWAHPNSISSSTLRILCGENHTLARVLIIYE